MHSKNEILIVVTHIFPRFEGDLYGIFVKNTVDTMSEMTEGDIIVINPIPIHKIYYIIPKLQPPLVNVKVHRPLFLSLPVRFIPSPFLKQIFSRLNQFSFFISALIISLKYRSNKMVFYGHFITFGGICAIDLGKWFGAKSFLFNGEDSFWSVSDYSLNFISQKLAEITGMIIPSTERINQLVEYFPKTEFKNIVVLPNGANVKRFSVKTKLRAKSEMGLDSKTIVGLFVGSFDKRKGADRLYAAIDGIGNFVCLFVGRGPINILPTPNCIPVGTVPNKDLDKYLAAADVFILPTRSEGSPNSMVEAICAGLPVISSNKKFLDDILDETNSIRVNEDSIEEIRAAIENLSNNRDLLRRLSKGSSRKSRSLDNKVRSKKLLRFIGR